MFVYLHFSLLFVLIIDFPIFGEILRLQEVNYQLGDVDYIVMK